MTLKIRLPELKVQDLLELNRQIKDVYDKLMNFADAFIELNKCIVEQIQNPNSVFNANLEDYAEAVRDALADLRDTFNNVQSALSNFSANVQNWKDELQNNINSAIQNWQNDITTAIPDLGSVADLGVGWAWNEVEDIYEIVINPQVMVRWGMNYKDVIIVLRELEVDLDRRVLRNVYGTFGQAWKNGSNYTTDSNFWLGLGDLIDNVLYALFLPSFVYNNWSYEDTDGNRKYYHYADYGDYHIYIELYVPKDNPPIYVCYPKFFEEVQYLLENWDFVKEYLQNINTVFQQLKDTLNTVVEYITDNIPYALNKLCDVLTTFDGAVSVDTAKIEEMRAKLIDSINNLRRCIGLEEISKGE